MDRFIAGNPAVQRDAMARCQRPLQSRAYMAAPPSGSTGDQSLAAPPPELSVYVLDTVPKLRKFSSFFDAIASAGAAGLPQESEARALACDRVNLPVFVTQQNPLHSDAAMKAHASQYVWFRRLFVWFSRHSFMVTLTPACFPPLGTCLVDVSSSSNSRSSSVGGGSGRGIIRTDSSSNRKGIAFDAIAHLLPPWYAPAPAAVPGSAAITGSASTPALAPASTPAMASAASTTTQQASVPAAAAAPALDVDDDMDAATASQSGRGRVRSRRGRIHA